MNGDIYPFFLECAEKTTSLYLKNCFTFLAFGKGGHIIERKNISVLVLPSSEFIIPKTYSPNEHEKIEKWLQPEPWFKTQNINTSRNTWASVRKKDKINLINKFVASLDLELQQKRSLCTVLILALFLKAISVDDISYDGEKITEISLKFLNESEIYNVLNKSCNHPSKIVEDSCSIASSSNSDISSDF
jgi:hypothetical protein